MYLKQLKSLLQDVDAAEIRVQVCVYAFDLLYLNGEVSPSANVETLTRYLHTCHFKAPFVFIACERVCTLTPGCRHHLKANEGVTGSWTGTMIVASFS